MAIMSRALWAFALAGVLLVATPLIVQAQTEKAPVPPSSTESAAEQEVIKANQAFYTAFRTRDLAAMEAVWARTADISVIHPGWPNVSGRKNVMESWRGILTGGASPEIRSVNPKTYIHGDTAFVVCYEDVGRALLIATNIFIREDGAWRMVHHQAGSTPLQPKPGQKI